MKKPKVNLKRFSVISQQRGIVEQCATLDESVHVAFALIVSEHIYDIRIVDNFRIEPEYHSCKMFGVDVIQSV